MQLRQLFIVSVNYVNDREGQFSNVLLDTIEKCLKVISGPMEALSLVLHHTDCMPEMNVIAQHGSTLRRLLLDCYGRNTTDHFVYDEHTMERLLCRLPHLDQLALALSGFCQYTTEYLQAMSERAWDKSKFAVGTVRMPARSPGIVVANVVQRAILKHVNPRLLNILSLPLCDNQDSYDINGSPERALSRNIASHIFRTASSAIGHVRMRASAASRIRIVAFGSHHRDSDESKIIHCYIPAGTWVLGNSMVTSIRVSLKRLELEDENLDVLLPIAGLSTCDEIYREEFEQPLDCDA